MIESRESCRFTPYSIHARTLYMSGNAERKKREAFLRRKRLEPSVEVRVTLRNTRQDHVTFEIAGDPFEVAPGGKAEAYVDDVDRLFDVGKGRVGARTADGSARLKKDPEKTVEAVLRPNGTARKYVVGVSFTARPSTPFS